MIARRLLLGVVLLAGLASGGCLEVLSLLASVGGSGVAAYQRLQDRRVQQEQNERIEALTQEIERGRLKAVPAYLCLYGAASMGSDTPVPSLLCSPVLP